MTRRLRFVSFADRIAQLESDLAESERVRFALLDALLWCGGSSDFAPRGQARRGWLRGPAKILGYLVGANDFPAVREKGSSRKG